MPSVFIPDGMSYTDVPVHPHRYDTGRPEPALDHPPVKISYRPATPKAVGEYNAALDRGDKVFAVVAADHLARHLKGWDAKDTNGIAVSHDKPEAIAAQAPIPYLTALVKQVNSHAAELAELKKSSPG